MPEKELESLFERADGVDYVEGQLAYVRYNMVMRSLAECYGVRIDRVVAAFCAMSPNNDYTGNLRSLVSVLDGYKRGLMFDDVQISTYRHCGQRAWSYVTGEVDFASTVGGLKITNFYWNILQPENVGYVTIDGHMCAAWRGTRATMKEAIVKSDRAYNEIAYAVKRLAFSRFLIPNQYQAIIWFVRKRVFEIKYDPQVDMFTPHDDLWRTQRNVKDIEPFPLRLR